MPGCSLTSFHIPLGLRVGKRVWGLVLRIEDLWNYPAPLVINVRLACNDTN